MTCGIINHLGVHSCEQHQPGYERCVLHRIPGPVASKCQGLISPGSSHHNTCTQYTATKKGKWGDSKAVIGGDKPSKGNRRVSKSAMPSRMKFKGRDGTVDPKGQKPLATPAPGVSTMDVQPSATQSVLVPAPEGRIPTTSRRGKGPVMDDVVVK